MLPLFFLLLSSSWGFFLASAAHAHLNNASDERALMAFRATLSLDPNMALRSWNTSVSLCSWTGVQCSLRHQRVVSLNLTGMSLHGPISPLLANLSFLRVLDLSNNSHYGPIPHDLGRLFRLRVLRLSKNQLEGPIPSTIGSCRLLELVSLSHNFLLNGSIPSELGLLRNLKFLWLGINKLTGSIPTSFGNMSSLKNLSLGANQLHGSIPSELGRLSQLNTLYLRHNYLSGKIPPSLSNCTLLVDLQLHDNQLTGHIPWEFGGRLSQLENLFLWGNKLGGEIPKTLANCTHLRVLDLKINKLTGMVPVQLGQLFRLERLFLGGNQLISGSSTTLPILLALTNCSFLEQIHIGENHLTGTIPSSIQQLSRLSVFNLSHNEIGGKIPPEIGKLANLTYLNLEWNIFNGSIPSTLGRLQKLERLYLGKNKLQGSIPTEIGGIQTLGLLSLSQNNLSGQIPHSLGQLKQLRELYLDQNNLSGNISPNIGDCLRLEVLDLSHNRFNGKIPRTVAGLPNLQFFFNLSSNLLEGPLPLEISKMTMVQEINVAVNRLTGSVPSELESCTEVNYLNLSWNSFDGPIPDSLGKLVFLEDLDLSKNNLSGTIPMSLENLKMLHHLNFSFNKLKGEVPKGGIFRRHRSGAFMGNLGLCGQWVQLQEGHGDIIQGLTHILGIWRNIGPCVIYMPKIEVWALEKVDEISESQGGADQNAVSRTWNMLLQQVDSIPPDVPLVFLATCELPGTALPLQIRNFFMNQDCDVSSLASKKNVPCFSVQLPSTSDCKWLFDQSAKNITKALMRRYIQFIHGLSHGDAISLRKSKTASSLGKLDERAGKNIINCPSKTCIEREDASLDEPKNICSEDDVGGFHKGSQCHSIGAKDYPVLSNIESEHLNLKDRHDWKQQWPSHMLQKPSHRGSGKGRTAMQLAIAACGYQLLHYPQFAELCWVTSKLNEGPCATTDGPWKRWPFNSCILDTNSSTQVASEDSSAEHKGMSASSVVRGLVAVGLLAFKGLYSTGKEVSRDIRKVLELLVKKIKTKIQNGKDKYQFFPLLAQAASLEDMVNSWAYATQSLETNSCIPVVDPSPCAEERSELSSQALTDINMVGHEEVNVQATSDAFPVSYLNNKKVISGNTLSPNVFKPGIYGPATCIIGREISSPRSLLANNAVLQGGCQPISPPVCDPNKFLLRGASVAQNNVDSGDAIEKSAQEATAARPTSFCRMINGTVSKADPSDGYEVQSGIKRSETLSTDHHFHDSETGILQSHGASADKNGGNVDATNKIEDSNLPSSQVQCVYRCCSECIHRLHLLVKQFVMNCWKADGCCDRFESVHDLVASCTARLLAVVAQFGVSKSTNKSGSMKGSVLLGQSSCSCEDTCDFHPVQTSSRGDANIKNEEITIRGCKCHASPRKRNARGRHGQDTSWLEENLEFVIFDHVCNSNMKSLNRTEDLHIHCQTEHVCFCSLIQKLSAIKQPRW